ncbi:MAG: thioesterase family protein [Pseudomonadota bacterium]
MADIPKLDQFAWRRPLTVRWGDMDSMGHVNNVKYFTYDEQVRIDYFAELMRDDPRFWKDYGLILAHIEADFVSQVHCPAELEIGFRISKLGRSSFQTEALMTWQGKAAAVTRAILVWFDYRNNQSLPLPEAVKQKIRAAEKTPPAE